MQERVLNNPKFDNEFAGGLVRYSNGERDLTSKYAMEQITAVENYSEIRGFEHVWGDLLDVIEPDFLNKFISDYSLYYSRLLEVAQEATSPDGSYNPNSAYDTLVSRVTD